MTYEEAIKVLKGRPSRKVQPNTILRVEDENTIAVKFWNTIIVQIHKDQTYTINSGGWASKTAKRRIAAFAPVRIQDGDIIAQCGGARSEFTDGMKINSYGEAI